MLRDVPDEAMPELFDAQNCHRVKHIATANAIVLGHLFPARVEKDAQLHRTPHGAFPNGWCELLHLFPHP